MKPIIFNTDMVRAILDGRKTVTRRVIKPQPNKEAHFVTDDLLPETKEAASGGVYLFSDCTVTHAPYQPGDILYVRETWARIGDDVDSIWFENEDELYDGMYIYRADYSDLAEIRLWHPSIHMPKEAARIFLRVTNVQAERLREIHLQDCLKEGVTLHYIEESNPTRAPLAARKRFAGVWDGTIKKTDLDRYGWEANPLVWVIEFERISREDVQNE